MKRLIPFTLIMACTMMAWSQASMKIDASFYSPALDAVRYVDIYLPQDYYVNTDTYHPVIYYLHGAGGNQNEGNYSALAYYSQHAADTSFDAPAAILVSPDGSCEPFSGSGWVNSPLYGNFEDYLIHDLIGFIEDNFRVIPEKEFRFITGYSMGGYGAAFQAIRHPDLFRGCAPSSASFLGLMDTVLNVWEDHIVAENGGYHFQPNAGTWSSLYFTISGVVSPNLDLPPYYVEMLWDTNGNMVDSVRAKHKAYDCRTYVSELEPADNLAFFLLCGTPDKFIAYPPYLEFADSLTKNGIEFVELYHEYDHGIYDPISHRTMFRWMDSLIADAYVHLSLDEEKSQTGTFLLQTWPNPTSGMLNINILLPNSMMNESRIDLLNSRGSVVYSASATTSQKHQIDLSPYSSGIYFVRVQAGNMVEMRKVVLLK